MLKVPRAHQKSTSKSLTLNHRYKVKEHTESGGVLFLRRSRSITYHRLLTFITLRKRRPCADTHFNKN
ncbi:hypothetical protein HanXRQr2_Chr16g0770181 [Helianthus annuus]|uniref:Uncharacterized protein n=1 Tax=Helianthus annuus TaxID=4232 RepID=A0A9K3H0D9_HELAN|nr:hypothetical protein HanXRQr2_Chr16g0770181 [Helianthus annuus]KAJ0822969.1 hypothetical protein HanPSC8_Chr16g0738231 [Helianthus annuus]